jgi:hypothetical protein
MKVNCQRQTLDSWHGRLISLSSYVKETLFIYRNYHATQINAEVTQLSSLSKAFSKAKQNYIRTDAL